MELVKYNEIFKKVYGLRIGGLGFTMVPNALLSYVKDLKLKPNEFAYICYLLSFQRNGGPIFPSTYTIMRKSGMCRRTTGRIKRHLKELGYLSIERKHIPKYHTYVYRLDALWRNLEAKIDRDKKSLLEQGLIQKEEYEDHNALTEMENDYRKEINKNNNV